MPIEPGRSEAHARPEEEPWPALKLLLGAEYDEREALEPEMVVARLRDLAAVTSPVVESLRAWTLASCDDHDRKARALEGGLGSRTRLLDVGTGSGLFALAAARNFRDWDVTGIDLSLGAVSAARGAASVLALANARFEVADVEALPWGARSFDVVVSGFALNLFPDKRRALAEIARILRGSGALVLAESFDEDARIVGPGPTSLRHLDAIANKAGFSREGDPIDVSPAVLDAVAKGAWPWAGAPARSTQLVATFARD